MAGAWPQRGAFRSTLSDRGSHDPMAGYTSLWDTHRTHWWRKRTSRAVDGVHLVGTAAHRSATMSRAFPDILATSRDTERPKTLS